jgi:2'-hydroxyisoflavone reductase
MLAPEPPSQPLQVVDVRDLAAFTVDHLEARTNDVYCVVGPPAPLTWGEALPELVRAGEADTRLTWVGESFLKAQLGDGVFDELPLWDVDDAGLHQVDVRKAVSAGLRHRPFDETVADTLAWDRDDGVRKAGLSSEREAELIAAWRATEAAT